MTDHLEDLKSLKRFAENERGKAQSKIYELRNKIKDIEIEISHYEGERDLADYLISKIEAKIKGFEADNEVVEGIE